MRSALPLLLLVSACATAPPHHPDAPEIARGLGVSVEEAERRLARQEEVGALQERLLGDPNLAGHYIEHEPQHRVVVLFVGVDPQAQLARYTTDPLYVAMPARYSHAQLLETQERLGQALANARIHFMSSSTDVRANRVVFEVVDEMEARTQAAAAGIAIPDEVVFVSRGGVIAEPQLLAPVEHLPQTRFPAGAEMAALARGRLILENGCIRIESANGESALVIWPSSALLERDVDRILIRDGEGGAAVAIGDRVDMGGGQSETIDQTFLTSPIPERCAGPYWIAGRAWRLPE